MVDKAFYKSTDKFGRSIACREGKTIPRVSIPIRTKHCPPFHDGSSLV